MSTDRILKFKDGTPSIAEVERVLKDYVGDSGELGMTDHLGRHTWLSVKLGPSSYALGSLTKRPSPYRDERHFEVWITEKSINVLTREQDDFTMYIAQGFAEILKRWYKSELVF